MLKARSHKGISPLRRGGQGAKQNLLAAVALVMKNCLLRPFCVHRVDATPCFRYGTVVPSFLSTIVPSILSGPAVIKKDDEPLLILTEAMSHCSREKVLMCTQKRELD